MPTVNSEKTVKPWVEKLKASGHYSRIGRVGGTKTKQRMLAKNPFYFEELGASGGRRMKEIYGGDYFSRIGKINLEKHGVEHFRRIGRLGAESQKRHYAETQARQRQ